MPTGGGRIPRIVAVGVACLDHAVAVEDLSAGERIGAVRYVQTGGGMAGTAMVAAQRLGARCALGSSVGDDAGGRFVVEELRCEGIHVKYVRLRPAGRTGVSLCLAEVRTGRKIIIGLAGGTQRLTHADVDDAFWRMLARAKLLHLDGCHHELAIQAAEHARAHGVPVHLDATICGRHTDRFLALSDIVFASQTFSERQFKTDARPDVLDMLADLTPARIVGVTMGAAGSVALDRKTGKRYAQPAFAVDVLDTVGAGDSYHGAMSFALASGWPLDRAMRLAAAVGALCCTGLGGREGLPDLAAARRFLRTARPIDLPRRERARRD